MVTKYTVYSMSPESIHSDPTENPDAPTDWHELTRAALGHEELQALIDELDKLNIEHFVEAVGMSNWSIGAMHYSSTEIRILVHPDDAPDAHRVIEAIQAEQRGRVDIHTTQLRRKILRTLLIVIFAVVLFALGASLENPIVNWLIGASFVLFLIYLWVSIVRKFMAYDNEHSDVNNGPE